MTNKPDIQVFSDPVIEGCEYMRGNFEAHSFGAHEHDEYMFGIVDRGAARLRCGPREATVAQHSAVLLNPGDPHSGAAAAGGWTCRDIRLRRRAVARFLGAEAAGKFRLRRNVVEDPATRAHIANIFSALGALPGVMARERAIIGLLRHLGAIHSEAGVQTPHGFRESRKMRQAREFIDAHFAGDIGLGDIARHLDLHPNYIITAFRQEFGITPRKYLISRRLAYAKTQIRQGAPLADAANAAGFYDQSHLTRSFRAEFGYTPSAYARAYKTKTRSSVYGFN